MHAVIVLYNIRVCNSVSSFIPPVVYRYVMLHVYVYGLVYPIPFCERAYCLLIVFVVIHSHRSTHFRKGARIFCITDPWLLDVLYDAGRFVIVLCGKSMGNT